jgi:hypothetical protein
VAQAQCATVQSQLEPVPSQAFGKESGFKRDRRRE